jgi:hypothetical protein
VVAFLAAAALTMACVEHSSDRSSQVERPVLPPPAREELTAILEPKVAPLGLRVARVALVDERTRTPAPDGRHLALYVEPTSAWTSRQFVEAIAPLAQRLVPDVFSRWPGLVSFDVCQEPPPGVDDRPQPPPVTTLEVTKEAVAKIEWGTADLSTVLAAVIRRTPGIRLNVSQPLSHEPALKLAEARAQEKAKEG